jgi:pilus assembly protein CpaB
LDFRSVIVALLGVSVAGASAYAAREYMAAQTAAATAAATAANPETEIVMVVAASQEIGYGQPIQPQNLRFIPWPAKAMPVGAYTTMDGLVPANGEEPRRAKYALAAGDLIIAHKVSDFGEKVTLVQTLGENTRAMAIKVDAVTAVGGFVTPGDSVDILLTQGNGAELRSVTILQNIRVLGVDQESDQQAEQTTVARTVTVEVSPIQGQTLALAQKAGTLSLTLRTLEGAIDEPMEYTSLKDLLQDESPVSEPMKKQTITIRRGNEVEVVEVN